MSVKTLKIKIISWQFLRFLLSFTVLFISRENHRNNSFLHRFKWENPTSIPFGYHSIYRAQFFTVHIYHLYNWCKIPVVFDWIFFQLSVCVVSLKPEEIETGGRSQISKQKKWFFLKFLFNECSFLTKGKYFMVVDILSQRLGQKFVMNMYVLKFRK